jgi:hypothetical protein
MQKWRRLVYFKKGTEKYERKKITKNNKKKEEKKE